MPNTLADVLAEKERLYVNCAHPACAHSTRLDVQALIARLGPDHGAMHWDLVGKFYCARCEAEGRERRPVFFTCMPDYAGIDVERMGTSSGDANTR